MTELGEKTTDELTRERGELAKRCPAGHLKAQRINERIAAIDAELEGRAGSPDVDEDGAALATVDNMRRFQRRSATYAECIALSLATWEEKSGNPDDYPDRRGADPLTDAEGEPMILVTTHVTYFDALSAEAL